MRGFAVVSARIQASQEAFAGGEIRSRTKVSSTQPTSDADGNSTSCSEAIASASALHDERRAFQPATGKASHWPPVRRDGVRIEMPRRGCQICTCQRPRGAKYSKKRPVEIETRHSPSE